MADDEDDEWQRDDGSRYRSIGQKRRARSQSQPSLDPAHPSDEARAVGSKLMLIRRYQKLVSEGYEAEAQTLKTGSGHVSDFSDQQTRAIMLCRRHLDGWDPRDPGGD